MPSLWSHELTEDPATYGYAADWPGEDAGQPNREAVQVRFRELREPEDDPRAEFVGAYLDRQV